jgi:hypothetical protein
MIDGLFADDALRVGAMTLYLPIDDAVPASLAPAIGALIATV